MKAAITRAAHLFVRAITRVSLVSICPLSATTLAALDPRAQVQKQDRQALFAEPFGRAILAVDLLYCIPSFDGVATAAAVRFGQVVVMFADVRFSVSHNNLPSMTPSSLIGV